MARKKNGSRKVTREVYPKPEHDYRNAKIGLTYAESEPDPPPMPRAPAGAPNIVLVLLDDAGYGVFSAFGGLVRAPAMERLAAGGLTYCQFHTTALCAPTRAALLTGRNHHTVATGVVQEMATGFPGYSGIIPRSCAMISEILSANGYATGFWGKNHNVPDNHTSAAGPFDHWPHRRGFDTFYGFIGGETDQFYPALFRNSTPVAPPKKPEEGYQLTRDLADDCIAWMRTQKTLVPDRPFFVHFAPGAVHGPHQPPLDWRGRNAGRFDMGWDRYREEALKRQIELGVVPRGTKLTPRPDGIPAWDSLSVDEQRLYARQMENFADYAEHCDYEIGRLAQALEEMGEYENTIFIYITGDNGSSAEGSLTGTIDEQATMSGITPPLDKTLARIDDWGLPGTFPHYAVGWAWAGDVPFQWVKQVASHFGGTRNGMIVTWPRGISDPGGKRYQFHHVIDIVPTLLEATGIAEPREFDGVTQKPIEGTSMVYTFDEQGAKAPGRRTIQYFEMLGNRGLYRDGWMASCRHARLPWVTAGTVDFSEDRWELYDLTKDFSQSEDLAEKRPEKVREMRDLWLVEAARHDVLPLDDRFVERASTVNRPNYFTGRRDLRLHRGITRLPEGSAPKTNNVDHTLTASLRIPKEGAEGVIACMGGATAGWSLFVDEGRLHYHYNWYDLDRYDVVASKPLGHGDIEVRMELRCDDPQTPGAPATVRLFQGGALVAEGRIEKQVRGRFGDVFDIGEDSLSPVYPGYHQRLPFRFTGEIVEVRIELGLMPEVSVEERMAEDLRAD